MRAPPFKDGGTRGKPARLIASRFFGCQRRPGEQHAGQSERSA
jgi:hypothetical protein